MLLDEPTTGLDPQARHLLWDRLYRLKQRGVTLVLTTHYMDEAEQLCDRLVVMDKAKIVAEGSPRELIERYSTREVTELRFAAGVQETLDGQLDGLAERIERLPDRVLLYADDGEAAVAAAHARGLRAGDRARPSVDARGRVPAADRPLADRVMARRRTTPSRRPRRSPGIGRVFEHRFLSYRRTFRASIFSSFLTPVLFLTAMGLGLGAYVDTSATTRSAACRTSRSSPLVCWSPRRCRRRSFEATFPIMAGLVWSRVFHAMYATPLTSRDVALGNLLWIAARLLLISTVFTVVIVLFGAALSPLVVFAIPVAVADGPGLRGADRGLLGHPADARPVRGDLPVRHHAAVPLLGHVLPGRGAATSRSSRSPG